MKLKVALITGITGQDGSYFIAFMPTNLYVTNNNFDFENSQMLPTLLH